jgi:hypothetical protein
MASVRFGLPLAPLIAFRGDANKFLSTFIEIPPLNIGPMFSAQ